MRIVIPIASGLLALALGSAAIGAELFVYPAAGQSEQQMNQDKGECSAFAKEETGFDPMNPPSRDQLIAQAQQGQPQQQGPDSGKAMAAGAARGALVGSAVGAWTDNSRRATGAAGAAIGGIRSGRRADQAAAQQQAQAQQQAEQQADAQLAQMRDAYNRAFAVCMEARDYTVR